jgi:hypothetical protein
VSAAATGVFRSLKNVNFRLGAAGALVSNVGTWLSPWTGFAADHFTSANS